MVRYNYIVTVLEDGSDSIIDTFTIDSVKNMYSILKSKYPDKMHMPLNTFSGYFIQQQKEKPWLRIQKEALEVIPKNIKNKEYRKRVSDKLKRQELEIIELKKEQVELQNKLKELSTN